MRLFVLAVLGLALIMALAQLSGLGWDWAGEVHDGWNAVAETRGGPCASAGWAAGALPKSAREQAAALLSHSDLTPLQAWGLQLCASDPKDNLQAPSLLALVKRFPDYAPLRTELLRSLLKDPPTGEQLEASHLEPLYEAAKAAVARFPEESYFHLVLAMAQAARGETDTALHSLEKGASAPSRQSWVGYSRLARREGMRLLLGPDDMRWAAAQLGGEGEASYTSHVLNRSLRMAAWAMLENGQPGRAAQLFARLAACNEGLARASRLHDEQLDWYLCASTAARAGLTAAGRAGMSEALKEPLQRVADRASSKRAALGTCNTALLGLGVKVYRNLRYCALLVAFALVAVAGLAFLLAVWFSRGASPVKGRFGPLAFVEGLHLLQASWLVVWLITPLLPVPDMLNPYYLSPWAFTLRLILPLLIFATVSVVLAMAFAMGPKGGSFARGAQQGGRTAKLRAESHGLLGLAAVLQLMPLLTSAFPLNNAAAVRGDVAVLCVSAALYLACWPLLRRAAERDALLSLLPKPQRRRVASNQLLVTALLALVCAFATTWPAARYHTKENATAAQLIAGIEAPQATPPAPAQLD